MSLKLDSRTIRHSIPIFIFLFICIIIALADINSTSSFRIGFFSFTHSDKVGHVFLYGTLAFATTFFTNFKNIKVLFCRASIPIIFITVFAFAEEFSQVFLSSRSFELLDLLSDSIGIIAGNWLALKLKPKFNILKIS